MPTKPRLIAIDPGYRQFGMAHFIGRQLIDFGVKSLRRPRRTHYAVLKETIERMLVEKKPDAIALELNNFAGIGCSRPVIVVTRRIQSIASRRGIPVFGFAGNTVKKIVCGDGRATKRTIAKVVTAQFPELRAYLGSNCRWRERYYQNMFDAVAVGLTYLAMAEESKLLNYAVAQ